jgi:prepilin-type N-terminal cleavage/methylation domain-containing protein
MNRLAFTLIEMMVVLVILSLVATLVTINYREPVNRVRLESAFETVERLDQRVRRWCKTNNTPARIRVDLDRSVFTAEDMNGRALPIPEASIPNGMRLKELRIMGENRFGRDTLIYYTSRGTTSTWAFSVAYSGNRERYRLIIGATGQSVSFDNEDALIRFERSYERE